MTDINYSTYGTAYSVSKSQETMTRDRLNEELNKIFINNSTRAINSLAEKIENVVASFYNDKEKNNDIEKKEFINIFFKGNYNKISDVLSEYLNNNTEKFDNSYDTRKDFFNLVHRYIISIFSLLDRYIYVQKTFPLWSKLKRRMLENRPDENMKQWEYAAQCCRQSAKKNEILNYFKNIIDYHDINNQLAKDAICRLVDDATEKRDSFRSTIDGWFEDKNKLTQLKNTKIEKETLLKIAYGLALTPKLMDDFGCGVITDKRDPFNFEDNMYRFGLNYKINYTNIKDIISKYQNQIKLTTRKIKTKSFLSEYYKAIEKFDNFFDDHKNIVEFQTILDDYLKLIEEIGRYNIEKIREEIAKECLKYIIKKLDSEKVKEYYKSKPESNKLPREFYPLDSKIHKDLRESLSDKITEKRNGVKELRNKNKFLTLPYIFDGKGYTASGVKTDKITNTNGYQKIIDKKLKIERETILRLGYLSTIVDYINDFGNISDDKLINIFETRTNKMLETCLFHELYYSRPEDVQMYLALSCKDYCKLDFYQAITD